MKKKRLEDKHTLTKHHRKAKCVNGTDDTNNISLVPRGHHQAYHLLFGYGEPAVIAKRLNETWIDPEYVLILVKRVQKRESFTIKARLWLERS